MMDNLAQVIMTSRSGKGQKDAIIEQAKKISETFRKKDSAVFYQAVKRVIKWEAQSTLAKEFATTSANPNPLSFQKYVAKLYGENPSPLPYKPSKERLFISTLEFKLAVAKLSKNKATGIDGLKDVQIKVLTRFEKFSEKMRAQFEEWLNGKNLPQYLITARTVFLSKDGTQYPKEGEVRIIAILPALMKLYELVLLQKIET